MSFHTTGLHLHKLFHLIFWPPVIICNAIIHTRDPQFTLQPHWHDVLLCRELYLHIFIRCVSTDRTRVGLSQKVKFCHEPPTHGWKIQLCSFCWSAVFNCFHYPVVLFVNRCKNQVPDSFSQKHAQEFISMCVYICLLVYWYRLSLHFNRTFLWTFNNRDPDYLWELNKVTQVYI